MTPPPLRREVQRPRPARDAVMPAMAVGTLAMLSIATLLAATASPYECHSERIDDVSRTRQITGERAPDRVSAFRAEMRERTDVIGACMREWSDRTGGSHANLAVRLKVSTSGLVDRIEASGMDDLVAPRCVMGAIQPARVPLDEDPVIFLVEVKYIEGQTRVATTPVADCVTPSRPTAAVEAR